MNPNENNQHVSNHLRKLWRSLIAADREPYQRKPPAFFHLRKYPDYVRNPPEACRRKEREHKVKQIASKLENDCSENQGSSQALPRPRPKVEEACSSSSNSICCHRRRRKETTVMKPLVPEAPRLHRPTTTVATAASARATARPYIVQRSSANEKRRWVAAQNPNENNERVCSHLVKRKATEVAAGHRKKHPDYRVYNLSKAHRRKEQERRANKSASKLKHGSSGHQKQQPSPSVATAKGSDTGPKSYSSNNNRWQHRRCRNAALANSRYSSHSVGSLGCLALYRVHRSSANITAVVEQCKRRAHHSVRYSSRMSTWCQEHGFLINATKCIFGVDDID
ncbi:uncharacterized protein LOC119440529 [Dermacentor silvarum]|uniref:uncharacterized protein LOC119440529 n=1 Tax=Dermacentor silvarum TaxID=543639 RepID=UPI0021013D81|nr:uncharacterized protein LOC119440529 [Dermacentor silvarum]